MSDSVYAVFLQSARQELLNARQHLSFSIDGTGGATVESRWLKDFTTVALEGRVWGVR
jgi:hypothetical protein